MFNFSQKKLKLEAQRDNKEFDVQCRTERGSPNTHTQSSVVTVSFISTVPAEDSQRCSTWNLKKLFKNFEEMLENAVLCVESNKTSQKKMIEKDRNTNIDNQ